MLKLYTENSGSDFNKAYKGTTFYKFLYDDLTHYEFKYQLGLNIDWNVFNPSNECSKGGLYFCEDNKCHLYFNQYGTKLALIKIPDDARVYIEEDKFKANKLIIKKITDFSDIGDNCWINMIPKNAGALKFVKNQTKDICELAVQKNGTSIEYVKEEFLTEDICIMAVKNNYLALAYISKQTDEMCRLAVQQNSSALYYVKNRALVNELYDSIKK